VQSIGLPDLPSVREEAATRATLPQLPNAFKAVTAAQGKEMTQVLLEFIRNYVEKHAAAPKKGGHR